MTFHVFHFMTKMPKPLFEEERTLGIEKNLCILKNKNLIQNACQN
jgi:hypothetical protein